MHALRVPIDLRAVRPSFDVVGALDDLPRPHPVPVATGDAAAGNTPSERVVAASVVRAAERDDDRVPDALSVAELTNLVPDDHVPDALSVDAAPGLALRWPGGRRLRGGGGTRRRRPRA